MKIAEVMDDKYIDYIRGHENIRKYHLIDDLLGLEVDEDTFKNIYNLFYNSKDLIHEYPDEFDRDMVIPDLTLDIEYAWKNHLKFVEDPTWDIDPEKDSETEEQMSIVEANRISVWIEDEDGNLIEKFIDKRWLDGTIQYD